MHLVSLVGQVALQQVAYLEVSVSAELRRRRILREEEKTKKRSDSSTKKQRPRVRTEGFFSCGQLFCCLSKILENALLTMHEIQGNAHFGNRNGHVLVRIDRES